MPYVRFIPLSFAATLFYFAIISLPGIAATLSIDGNAKQGGLLIGNAGPGAVVEVNGGRVRVSKDGQFLVGFGRNARPKSTIHVQFADGTTQSRVIAVAKRRYKIQRIDGLPAKKVTPDPKAMQRIKHDSALIAGVRQRDRDEAGFASSFVWPVRGRISGVFGSQRILNDRPRSPHAGVDVAAPKGTPVVATADGVVELAEDDMFFTGKTIMIDHGHGLASVYAHMNRIIAVKGQRVQKGQVIGAIGMTGRATGPHLHWGISLFNRHLDPALIAGPMVF